METDARQQAEPEQAQETADKNRIKCQTVKEMGGPKGLEPTRYGDWERKGRCIDF